MTINELVKEAFKNAVEKGWHDKTNSPLEYHMLIVSEIAEATEEVRNKKLAVYTASDSSKPEGELIELADAIIRIADYCGFMHWDLEAAIKMKMEYNKTRPYKHGGKAI